MTIVSFVPDDLAAAINAYRQAFGHAVPPEVVQLFVTRPGPLVMEIRQAVALSRPVPAWLARSKVPNVTPSSDWSSRAPELGAHSFRTQNE
jgi:hypothetical protein